MIRMLLGAMLLGLATMYWMQPPGVADLPGPDQPVELGAVHWTRDLDTAKRVSLQSGKPVLVLFQEVHGCETCQDFGSGPLSHPLMVEAIEQLFTPVLVFNNKPSDEKILRAFGEPAWNNPVVRFLDGRGRDVIERKDSVWDLPGTAGRMVEALRATDQPVPAYLQLLIAEHSGQTEQATFAMHCYWEGEAKLGLIEGVRKTRSAWVGDKEVVHVAFDPQLVDFAELLRTAQTMQCASQVFAHSAAQLEYARQCVGGSAILLSLAEEQRQAEDSDQLYYLRNSSYQYLPLTALQQVRVNGALGQSADPHVYLSPRQVALYARIQSALGRNADSLDGLSTLDSELPLAGYQQKLQRRLDKILQ